MSASLEQLARDAATRRRLDERRNGLIVMARGEGNTWRAIAETLGMTQQAVRDAAAKWASASD